MGKRGKTRANRRGRGKKGLSFNVAPSVRSVLSGMSFRAIGSCCLGSFAAPSNAYHKGASGPMSASLLGQRMLSLSALYEKYKVNSIEFEVTLTCPTSIAGQYVLAFDHDIGDEDPPNTQGGVLGMLEWHEHLVCSTFDGVTHRLKLPPSAFSLPGGNSYYTSYDKAGDLRFSYFGQWYLYSMSVTNVGVGIAVTCHYDVTYYVPQLGGMVAGGTGKATGASIDPTAGRGWNGVATVIQDVADTVRGVSKIISVLGDIGMRFTEGKYEITQALGASSYTSGTVGLGTPTIATYSGLGVPTLTSIAGSGVSGAGAYGYENSHLVVPPGTTADLYGNAQVGVYDNCTAVISVSPLGR